ELSGACVDCKHDKDEHAISRYCFRAGLLPNIRELPFARRTSTMNESNASRLSRESLRFGMFMGPFHAPNLDPTYALERDLQLVTLLDSLALTRRGLANTIPEALRSFLLPKCLLPPRRSARNTSSSAPA